MCSCQVTTSQYKVEWYFSLNFRGTASVPDFTNLTVVDELTENPDRFKYKDRREKDILGRIYMIAGCHVRFGVFLLE